MKNQSEISPLSSHVLGVKWEQNIVKYLWKTQLTRALLL